MNNKKPSIDGFIPRRSESQMINRPNLGEPTEQTRRKELKSETDLEQSAIVGEAREGQSIGSSHTVNRSDIDESLRELDAEPGQGNQKPPRGLSRREKKRWKNDHRTRKQKMRRRIILSVIWVLVAVLVAAGGYLAWRTLSATGNVLNGNVFDLIQNEPLKEDENGRSNFLIVGTSEDDKGHQGGNLTDSIMVLSIDQDKHDAYMFSIPRDLYVEYGTACLSGYRGKINVYFSCSNQGTDDAAEQDRLTKTQTLIGDILGMDIQYGVHVNYTVMRDVVDAIGGSITVDIDSRDPRGVMDSNFDWKCGATYYERIENCPPNGHFIDFPNGEVKLNSEQALYLAQARGASSPTYGFEESNFDRERNQQMIAVAIRDKALSTGTLTNLGAVTGLIDALGNNLRTNIETKEIRTIMDVAQKIPNDKIYSLDFYDEEDPIFTTGPINGESSVYPAAGLYQYGELRAMIDRQMTSDPVVKEEPHVMVLNGSETAGLAQTVADALTEKHFTIDAIDNAPDGTYAAVEIYQLNTEKTASLAKLKELYSGAVVKTTSPPVSIYGETDFVIIIGDPSAVQ